MLHHLPIIKRSIYYINCVCVIHIFSEKNYEIGTIYQWINAWNNTDIQNQLSSNQLDYLTGNPSTVHARDTAVTLSMGHDIPDNVIFQNVYTISIQKQLAQFYSRLFIPQTTSSPPSLESQIKAINNDINDNSDNNNKPIALKCSNADTIIKSRGLPVEIILTTSPRNQRLAIGSIVFDKQYQSIINSKSNQPNNNNNNSINTNTNTNGNSDTNPIKRSSYGLVMYDETYGIPDLSVSTQKTMFAHYLASKTLANSADLALKMISDNEFVKSIDTSKIFINKGNYKYFNFDYCKTQVMIANPQISDADKTAFCDGKDLTRAQILQEIKSISKQDLTNKLVLQGFVVPVLVAASESLVTDIFIQNLGNLGIMLNKWQIWVENAIKADDVSILQPFVFYSQLNNDNSIAKDSNDCDRKLTKLLSTIAVAPTNGYNLVRMLTERKVCVEKLIIV